MRSWSNLAITKTSDPHSAPLYKQPHYQDSILEHGWILWHASDLVLFAHTHIGQCRDYFRFPTGTTLPSEKTEDAGAHMSEQELKVWLNRSTAFLRPPFPGNL